MIQLSSLMWATAIFFAMIGFLRGWNRELIAAAGILLALFTVFQFDGLLRATIFQALPREQIFLIQAGFFIAIVFTVYQAREIAGDRRDNDSLQESILGGLVGFLNGYLITGSLWYLLDINEYPLTQFIVAPSPASPSAQPINWTPLVLISGSTSGTGDLLAVGVIVLLFLVLVVL